MAFHARKDFGRESVFSPPTGRHFRLTWSNSMTQRPLRLRLAIPLLITMVLGGCTTIDNMNSFSSLQPANSENFRFPDVPVPAGLSMVREDSFILETPDTHAGQLVYAGFANYQSVVRFYRERMPNHGWQLLSSIERGEAALIYEKPGWSATIFIRTSYFRTRVSINIGPKGEKSLVEQDIPPRKK